jgi:hypothetical protein
MRWAGHVARMGRKRNAYRLLVGKSEGKRPLGTPRRRWVDNTGCGKLTSFCIWHFIFKKGSLLAAPCIRMDLGEVGWSDVDWIGLAQDRNRWRALVNLVLNFRVPWNTGKLSSGLTSSGLSSSAQLHNVSKLVTVQIFGNRNNKFKFESG